MVASTSRDSGIHAYLASSRQGFSVDPMQTTISTSASRVAPVEAQRAFGGTLVLFFASGASGLMLEIVWTRMLGWLLGATTWSVMTVLVAYLGGLGLGAWLWGRRASRAGRPLRLFGVLEIAIGLYSLAVPILFGWLGEFFVAAMRIVGDSAPAVMTLRVVAAVLALAPPTLLMGGTLPVLTRFASFGRAQPGRTAGLLYAANTAGAVVGCSLAGCVLIHVLGVIETNLAASLIDLGVGGTALYWSRGTAAIPADREKTAVKPATVRVSGATLLWIASVSGFCGLAYEVLWTRALLATVTDDTTYAFALMLTAFLAGHAAGAGKAARMAKELGTDRGWRQLGAAQMLAATAALLSVPFLVAIRDPISVASFTERMSFWGARIPFHLALGLAVFAPSAFFLGASFSIAARLYVGRDRPVGTSTGALYGWNTLGAIIGSIVATVWMIPTFGAQQALVVLSVFQASNGALAILARGGALKSWPERLYTTAVWAAVLAVACGLNYLLPLATVYAKQEPGRLLALVEGVGAAVTVHERTVSDRVISINGVNVAGTNPVLRATQKLQAHLPVCLHPSPRTVMQIGFGSGGTCYSVSLHSEIQSIEVVELNPDVLKVAATWFRDINHGVLDDLRVRVRIADAKSYVAATDQTYDLIMSDSTHPRFRGNAALYARDYFAHCSRRLKPGGLVSTWLPLYGLSVEDVRGILKSMQSVFPHVQVWYWNGEPHENTILIASLQPILIDPKLLAQRLALSPIANDLAEIGIKSTSQLLDCFLLGDRAVADFSRTGKLNTDDHPRLEFLAPRSLRRKQSLVENFAALRLAREPIDAYLINASLADRAVLARWYAGTTQKLAAQSFELDGRGAEALSAYAECVRLNPDDVMARNRLDRLRQALGAASRSE
jgi:spermidine synthase